MAAATRLTEPLRTSPTANMPGLLVSQNNGVRFSSSSGGRDIAAGQEEPCLSSASWPESHPVPGFAPMKTNSPVTASPEASGWPSRESRTASSSLVPARAVT